MAFIITIQEEMKTIAILAQLRFLAAILLKKSGTSLFNKALMTLKSPVYLAMRWQNLVLLQPHQETALILASFSSIKEEVLNIDDLAYFIIRKMKELYPNQLMERYGLDCLDDDIEFIYEMIGKKRGALKKGGIIDYDKVSKIIVLDFRGRFFGNVTFDRLDS